MDWQNTKSIVIQRADPTAVFDSGVGTIVIEQPSSDPTGEIGDQTIVIPKDRLKDFITALKHHLPEE